MFIACFIIDLLLVLFENGCLLDGKLPPETSGVSTLQASSSVGKVKTATSLRDSLESPKFENFLVFQHVSTTKKIKDSNGFQSEWLLLELQGKAF